ncbi:MAG TPA: hypothetical protein VGR96_02460 [Acidobacteriaceae bacterium]|nr:hypothetical protein [Acidobacteriaceae bacterium]
MPHQSHKDPKPHSEAAHKNAPSEIAPNSTQPVEAADKAHETHSPDRQKGVLNQDGASGPSNPQPPTDQPAGQHATGSFSGPPGSAKKPKQS